MLISKALSWNGKAEEGACSIKDRVFFVLKTLREANYF